MLSKSYLNQNELQENFTQPMDMESSQITINEVLQNARPVHPQ